MGGTLPLRLDALGALAVVEGAEDVAVAVVGLASALPCTCTSRSKSSSAPILRAARVRAECLKGS